MISLVTLKDRLEQIKPIIKKYFDNDYDPETMEQVREIIKSDAVTCIYCEVCHKKSNAVIKFHVNKIRHLEVCRTCLKEALSKIY